jgi:predicted DsbA family dithiol-disulfide isomerase
MATLEIKIYFDTICPWCYIGHKSLQRAIELYQRTYPNGRSDTFVYTLLPYYLRPDAEVGVSVPTLEAIGKKNGEERVNAITTRLQRVGRSNGIEFSFKSRIGNTRDSHRLIRFATREKQKVLLEEIYKLHFEQDADITSHDDLVKAAVNIDMDRDAVLSFLKSADGAVEVDELAATARQQDGISSVPTIEIGDRRIEGAEDVGDFYEALVAAREALQS